MIFGIFLRQIANRQALANIKGEKMSKRKKIEFEHKCESCGHNQEPDKEKSNENWTVYSTTCSKCGGRVIMAIST